MENQVGKSQFSGVVLAAGKSERFSPLLKPLIPVEGKAVISLIINKLIKANVGSVVAVLGYKADEVKKHINREVVVVRVVVNNEFRRGMLTSVKLGVSIEPQKHHVIFPVDHMLVREKTIATLLEKCAVDKISIPKWKGKRGHPIIIPADFSEELLEFKGHTLRDFVHTKATQDIVVDDPGVVMNINTPEEYKKYVVDKKIKN
jgi:molybdenum cofactor cytidylyltransferase